MKNIEKHEICLKLPPPNSFSENILVETPFKALELEQDLSLPTHLPMPSVNVDQKKDEGAEQYIG